MAFRFPVYGFVIDLNLERMDECAKEYGFEFVEDVNNIVESALEDYEFTWIHTEGVELNFGVTKLVILTNVPNDGEPEEVFEKVKENLCEALDKLEECGFFGCGFVKDVHFLNIETPVSEPYYYW